MNRTLIILALPAISAAFSNVAVAQEQPKTEVPKAVLKADEPVIVRPVPDKNRPVVVVPDSTPPAKAVLEGPVPARVAPQPEAPLSLEESIALALQNHGDVAAAGESFAAATERITAARAGGTPQLGLSAGYNNNSRVGGSTTGTFSSNNTTAGLILSQNLFDSGLRAAQTRAARAGARGSLAGVGQARALVAFDVASSYFDQLRQERLLELAREQVTLAQQNLELVRAQAQAGVAARVDQQPIEVELRQREFNLTQAQSNVRVAQVNFRNALGLGRGPALKIRDVTGEAPALGGIENFYDEAQRLNPDLKISRSNVDTAQANLDVAKIRSRPQFSVDASVGVGVFDSARRQSGFSAGVTLPILDGGARRADRNAAQNNLNAIVIRDEQLAKDLAANIESAYATAQSARDSIAVARALEEAARTNLNVAQERYRQGVGITLEITSAQVQLFNAQVSAVQSLYDYYLAQAALERATGRRSGLEPGAAATAITTTTVVPVATTQTP